MRRRLRLSYSTARGFYVDMPTYAMVPGTFLPVVAGVIDKDGPASGGDPTAIMGHNPSVEVILPDDVLLTVGGMIDAASIRHRYSSHHRFGLAAWNPPDEVA